MKSRSNNSYRRLGFCPPSDWETVLRLNKENSLYYDYCTKIYGRALADYYWSQREENRDYLGQKECDNLDKIIELFISKHNGWKGYGND